jgi:hypothetical protein
MLGSPSAMWNSSGLSEPEVRSLGLWDHAEEPTIEVSHSFNSPNVTRGP